MGVGVAGGHDADADADAEREASSRPRSARSSRASTPPLRGTPDMHRLTAGSASGPGPVTGSPGPRPPGLAPAGASQGAAAGPEAPPAPAGDAHLQALPRSKEGQPSEASAGSGDGPTLLPQPGGAAAAPAAAAAASDPASGSGATTTGSSSASEVYEDDFAEPSAEEDDEEGQEAVYGASGPQAAGTPQVLPPRVTAAGDERSLGPVHMAATLASDDVAVLLAAASSGAAARAARAHAHSSAEAEASGDVVHWTNTVSLPGSVASGGEGGSTGGTGGSAEEEQEEAAAASSTDSASDAPVSATGGAEPEARPPVQSRPGREEAAAEGGSSGTALAGVAVQNVLEEDHLGPMLAPSDLPGAAAELRQQPTVGLRAARSGVIVEAEASDGAGAAGESGFAPDGRPMEAAVVAPQGSADSGEGRPAAGEQSSSDLGGHSPISSDSGQGAVPMAAVGVRPAAGSGNAGATAPAQPPPEAPQGGTSGSSKPQQPQAPTALHLNAAAHRFDDAAPWGGSGRSPIGLSPSSSAELGPAGTSWLGPSPRGAHVPNLPRPAPTPTPPQQHHEPPAGATETSAPRLGPLSLLVMAAAGRSGGRSAPGSAEGSRVLPSSNASSGSRGPAAELSPTSGSSPHSGAKRPRKRALFMQPQQPQEEPGTQAGQGVGKGEEPWGRARGTPGGASVARLAWPAAAPAGSAGSDSGPVKELNPGPANAGAVAADEVGAAADDADVGAYRVSASSLVLVLVSEPCLPAAGVAIAVSETGAGHSRPTAPLPHSPAAAAASEAGGGGDGLGQEEAEVRFAPHSLAPLHSAGDGAMWVSPRLVQVPKHSPAGPLLHQASSSGDVGQISNTLNLARAGTATAAGLSAAEQAPAAAAHQPQSPATAVGEAGEANGGVADRPHQAVLLEAPMAGGVGMLLAAAEEGAPQAAPLAPAGAHGQASAAEPRAPGPSAAAGPPWDAARHPQALRQQQQHVHVASAATIAVSSIGSPMRQPAAPAVGRSPVRDVAVQADLPLVPPRADGLQQPDAGMPPSSMAAAQQPAEAQAAAGAGPRGRRQAAAVVTTVRAAPPTAGGPAEPRAGVAGGAVMDAEPPGAVYGAVGLEEDAVVQLLKQKINTCMVQLR